MTSSIENGGPQLLTDQMRSATKAIHDKSDKLVNLKLALVLTSPSLYGEAIGLFLPVFQKMEAIMDGNTKHPQLGKFRSFLDTLRRTPAFKADMAYYLPSDRRKELQESFVNREHPVIAEYLERLDKLEKEDPIRVLAYFYHLNGGILAGGQIIRKVVVKALGLPKDQIEGVQIFMVKDDVSISSKGLFQRIKKVFNEELELSEKEKNSLLEESPEVFRLNNKLVGSVKGTSAWKLAADSFVKKFILICVLLSVCTVLAWNVMAR